MMTRTTIPALILLALAGCSGQPAEAPASNDQAVVVDAADDNDPAEPAAPTVNEDEPHNEDAPHTH